MMIIPLFIGLKNHPRWCRILSINSITGGYFPLQHEAKKCIFCTKKKLQISWFPSDLCKNACWNAIANLSWAKNHLAAKSASMSYATQGQVTQCQFHKHNRMLLWTKKDTVVYRIFSDSLNLIEQENAKIKVCLN